MAARVDQFCPDPHCRYLNTVTFSQWEPNRNPPRCIACGHAMNMPDRVNVTQTIEFTPEEIAIVIKERSKSPPSCVGHIAKMLGVTHSPLAKLIKKLSSNKKKKE